MDSVFILVIKEEGYDPAVLPTGFLTAKEARDEAIRLLKDSYQCNVLDSYDYDEMRKPKNLECIVEDELAYYEGDNVVFQYILQEVRLPKGG